MIQGKLFFCNMCGGDQLTHPHEHDSTKAPTIQLYRCPICMKFTLLSEDPNDAEWVALGEAVCGPACHAEAYSLMRESQPSLQLHHPP